MIKIFTSYKGKKNKCPSLDNSNNSNSSQNGRFLRRPKLVLTPFFLNKEQIWCQLKCLKTRLQVKLLGLRSNFWNQLKN